MPRKKIPSITLNVSENESGVGERQFSISLSIPCAQTELTEVLSRRRVYPSLREHLTHALHKAIEEYRLGAERILSEIRGQGGRVEGERSPEREKENKPTH